MSVEMVGCSAPYRELVGAKLAAIGVGEDDDVTISMVAVTNDDRWTILQERIDDTGVVAVAIVDELTIDSFVDAVAAGVDGVVFSDTASDVTAEVVKAAVQGEILIPKQAAQEMARLAKKLRPKTDLTDTERSLLTSVARGVSVVQLATDQFYSERTVRRHLQSLYLKLGVQNRAEAIATASRMGLLD